MLMKFRSSYSGLIIPYISVNGEFPFTNFLTTDFLATECAYIILENWFSNAPPNVPCKQWYVQVIKFFLPCFSNSSTYLIAFNGFIIGLYLPESISAFVITVYGCTNLLSASTHIAGWNIWNGSCVSIEHAIDVILSILL